MESNRKIAIGILFSGLVLSVGAYSLQAHTHESGEVCNGFLPENNLKIPVGMESAGTMTEDEFNNVIDTVEAVYAPIVDSKGGTLQVDRLWTNSTVNARASRPGSGVYKVEMFGGLARHRLMTPDGFALVLCHEIGHHIAGAPKVRSIFGTNWASNEGQSDYFATTKCFRKAYRSDDNTNIVSTMSVPEIVSEQCRNSLQDIANTSEYANELALCQRSAVAGKVLGSVLGSLGSPTVTPDFGTPNRSRVSRTNDRHPEAQCRLDTYFAGAICSVSDNDDFEDRDETAGACVEGSHAFGFRPRCWFAPSNKVQDDEGQLLGLNLEAAYY